MPTVFQHPTYDMSVTLADAGVVRGNFVNGEPWAFLSAPMDVTGAYNPSIEAVPSGIGGAQLNPVPGGTQGYAPRLVTPTDPTRYSAAKDAFASFPFTVNPGDTLAVGKTVVHGPGIPTEDKTLVYCVGIFYFMAVMPSVGDFAPNPYGSAPHPVLYNESDVIVNINALPNLTHVTLSPDQAYIETPGRLPVSPGWDWHSNWDGTAIRPPLNAGARFKASYTNTSAIFSASGGDSCAEGGITALWLLLDNAYEVKRKAAINMIQRGIYLSGLMSYVGGFYGSGQHQPGNLFSILFAGKMTGDTTMLAQASSKQFVETVATWLITLADAGRSVQPPNDISYPPTTYELADVGLYEWGMTHAWDGYKDNRNWELSPIGNSYRYEQWPRMIGFVLAMDLLGWRPDVDHLPLFGYTERFVEHPQGGLYFEESFFRYMWFAYKEVGLTSPVVWPPRNLTFNAPFTATVTTVSLDSTIRYTLDGTEVNNFSDIVVGGQVYIPNSCTLKTRTYRGLETPSNTTTRIFTINTSQLAPPERIES